MGACNHQGIRKVWQLWLFYQLPRHAKYAFPFGRHSDVICCDKFGWCLVNIYDELIWNVVLNDFIGNFIKKLRSRLNPPCNDWPRCSDYVIHYDDRTQDLVTLKSMYLPNLSGFAQIRPFSTLETTWMLMPAPAVRRFMSIDRSLESSSSSKRNGRPLTYNENQLILESNNTLI